MKLIRKVSLLGMCIMGVSLLGGCGNTEKKIEQNSVIVGKVTEEPTNINSNAQIKVNNQSNGIADINFEYVGINDDGTILEKLMLLDKDGSMDISFIRVDSKGNVLNKYENFTDMQTFDYDRSVVSCLVDNPEPGKSGQVQMQGVIDTNGNFVIKPEYTRVYKKNGRFFLVEGELYDTYGSLGSFDSVLNSNGGMVFNGPKEGWKNGVGELIVPNENVSYAMDFVYYNGKIYKENGEIIDLKLKKEMRNPQPINSSVLRLYNSVSKKSYYVGSDGKIEEIKNRLMGDIYENGNIYWITNLKKGVVEFYSNNKVVKGIESKDYSNKLINGMIVVKKPNEKYMAITPDGKIVTKEEYAEMSPFNRHGYAIAQKLRANGSGGFWVVLDKNGSEVIGEDKQIVNAVIDKGTTEAQVNRATVRLNENKEKEMLINMAEPMIMDVDNINSKIKEELLKK